MNPYLLRISTLGTGKAFIIGLVVTLFYYQMAYEDGERYRKVIASAGAELSTELEKEKETDRALARKNQLEISYKALSEQFQMVTSQIPTDLDSAEVIRTVDTMAKTSGITIKSKEPRPSQKEDILEVYPIRVVAEGNYAEMTMFFYNLSVIDRVYRVRAFTFTAPEDRRARMTMDAEITSFKFVGEPAPTGIGGAK